MVKTIVVSANNQADLSANDCESSVKVGKQTIVSDIELDHKDKELLNVLQMDFPLESKPFELIGERIGISEQDVIERVRHLKDHKIVRQISAIFDSRALGYRSSLVAFKVDSEKIKSAAAILNLHTGVSHNYRRDHDYNLWFTLTVPAAKNLEREVAKLAEDVEAKALRLFPTLKLFKIGVAFDMVDERGANTGAVKFVESSPDVDESLDEDDIALVKELQNDLDIAPRPFEPMAQRLGLDEEDLLVRAKQFIQTGVMRRYAAVLRHREAGFAANAMGAWRVPVDRIDEVGRMMSASPAVSHCYQRPTYDDWPYALFTMIHGKSREDCEEIARKLSSDTGVGEYIMLYSSDEYKKERVRYFEDD